MPQRAQGNKTSAKQERDRVVLGTIGEKLRAIREEQGLTRAKLADLMRGTVSAVQRAEDGLGITLPDFLAAADALDANLYDLAP